ncbi:MAG: TIGR03936 family radical SAM-associated protein [Synergistaceae bacterium]|nr:TIGR03936 family radical SAM-associated protein [Synergistaceae bacterium]
MRTRFIYSKRGGACFVPHIALAQIFSRTASRAGLKLIMTQGFSPRAKISFAPELPAGVVALAEAVDMYFDDVVYDDLISRMNDALPEGFNISRTVFPEENSPSLGKLCTHAEYLVRSVNNLDIKNYFINPSIIKSNYVDDWFRFIIREPAQNPIGGFIKNMIKENIIAGWHEVNIVRVAIGHYDEISNAVKMP